jgi:hypothetical protein
MSTPKVSNLDVLVTVHGYYGDQHQIRHGLKTNETHGCPIVIFSPEDSAIKKMGPHICRAVGRRAYTGPLSLERQKLHLQAMLEYPFEYFLANDSDSYCLAPQLPEYLFDEDVLWSNEVADTMHNRDHQVGYQFPRLAFQPPYFMSRNVVEQLVAVADSVPCDPLTPFIDWCMMSWAIAGNIPHKNYKDGISCPSTTPEGFNWMRHAVRNEGRVMVHSVKSFQVLNRLLDDRKFYLDRRRVNVNVNRSR